MSLLKTKPHYFPTAIATESGWINPVTKELLVSVGGLKSKLALELGEVVVEPVVAKIVIETEKEIVMEVEKEVKPRKEYTKKPKVIGEVTEAKVPTGQQLIGEVVEYKLDQTVIGE